MSDKTKEELEEVLAHKELCEGMRNESDKRYAKIIVERIVYTLISLIALAFMASLFRLIWK